MKKDTETKSLPAGMAWSYILTILGLIIMSFSLLGMVYGVGSKQAAIEKKLSAVEIEAFELRVKVSELEKRILKLEGKDEIDE